MPPYPLVRIRFPPATVDRLDTARHRLPSHPRRAALVRAIVQALLPEHEQTEVPSADLVEALRRDLAVVHRGRRKGPQARTRWTRRTSDATALA